MPYLSDKKLFWQLWDCITFGQHLAFCRFVCLHLEVVIITFLGSFMCVQNMDASLQSSVNNFRDMQVCTFLTYPVPLYSSLLILAALLRYR